MTTILGGPGDETFDEQLGDGVTAIDGGGGINTLAIDWSSATDPLSFNEGSITRPSTGQTLTWTNIQNIGVVGGSGDDRFDIGAIGLVHSVAGGGGSNSLYVDLLSPDPITSRSTGDGSGVVRDTVTGQTLDFTQIQLLDIAGGPGDDHLVGGAESDFFGGAGGRDTLQGGGGDDFLYGDASTTAVFSGNRSDYTIITTPYDFFNVVDQRPGSPDGYDWVFGVGRLQFADTIIQPVQSFDLSGSSDSFKVTFDTPTGSGSIEDVTTGAVITFDHVSELNVGTGSGDDTFVVTGTQASFNFDGGGGQNHLKGDFSDITGSRGFTLDSTPGATSTLNGAPYATLGSMTNIQSVDIITQADAFPLTGGDGNDTLSTGGGNGSVVDGGGGDDTITGGFALLGGPGNDVLIAGVQSTKYPPPPIMTGGPGDDTLYGQGLTSTGPFFYGQWSAHDIATYSGDLASYSISTDASGVTTITDLRPGSPDGTDTLIDVALLQFADGNVYEAIHGPEIAALAPSNDLVEAGAGVLGVSSAVVTLQLSDTVGTPVYVDQDGAPLGTGQVVLDGYYGSAVLDTVANTLTYTLDDARAVTDALLTGDVSFDTFQITISDGHGYVGQTSVDFTVLGSNDAPVAVADSASTAYATPLIVTTASLLANDADAEGDALALTAVNAAQHGVVSLSGGAVTFTPYAGYVGAAGFSYTVDDGHGGTAVGQVSVNVTGVSPAYLYRGGVTAAETIDFTGDAKSHQVLVGSGDTAVLMGSGGGSAHLGAGTDVVVGGTGKDSITFGPGLGTATGGAGPDAFIFVKGQIADPNLHGGQYDTITDFTGAGGWVPGRDFIWLQGFSHATTLTYEHDLSGDATAHLYRIDDGAYHAEIVLQYAGAGVALTYGQYGFL